MEYKIEIHAHTSETSNCGKLPGSQQAQGYAIAGYSTLVITDHISAGRFANGFRRPEDRAEMFLTGWRAARAEGEKWGLHVLLGAEARLVSGDEDFLLLGIEPEHIAPLMLLLDAYVLAFCSQNLKGVERIMLWSCVCFAVVGLALQLFFRELFPVIIRQRGKETVKLFQVFLPDNKSNILYSRLNQILQNSVFFGLAAIRDRLRRISPGCRALRLCRAS